MSCGTPDALPSRATPKDRKPGTREKHESPRTVEVKSEVSKVDPPRSNANGPSLPEVHIDVQIHIASDTSLEQIDQIFSSMRKHLYGGAR
jgi:hypothetical protein